MAMAYNFERYFVPVAPEVTARVLGEIDTEPEGLLINENNFLSSNDYYLDGLVDIMSNGFSSGNTLHSMLYSRLFRKGAVFSYRLLRTQAKTNGVALPITTYESDLSVFQELRSTAKPNEALADYTARQMDDLRPKDAEFVSFLRQLDSGKVGSEYLHYGGLTIYHALSIAPSTPRVHVPANPKTN